MWEYGPGPRASGATWSPRAGAGSGPEVDGADVELRTCGLRSPSVWLTLGTFRPCSQSLIPGARATGRFGRVGQLRVPGRNPMICVELQVSCAGACCRALFCWLDWLGIPTKLPGRKFNSSKATPVYHPRG